MGAQMDFKIIVKRGPEDVSARRKKTNNAEEGCGVYSSWLTE
jgi:hypothetical protein